MSRQYPSEQRSPTRTALSTTPSYTFSAYATPSTIGAPEQPSVRRKLTKDGGNRRPSDERGSEERLRGEERQRSDERQRERQGQGGGRVVVDSRETARMHFLALRRFLREWLENETPNSRASAREKLTRLTKSQFQELSTDVYDELLRRESVDAGTEEQDALPFLPVRPDFHPKRNQARQKLATLPKNRFKDLASDVFYELRRRYGSFDEDGSAGAPQMPNNDTVNRGPSSRDMGSTSRYLDQSQSRPNRDDGRERERERDEMRTSTNTRPNPPAQTSSERLMSGPVARNPSMSARGAGMPSSQSQTAGLVAPASGSSMNEMVVPNKSTISEEMIEVPYAQMGGDDDDDDRGRDREEELISEEERGQMRGGDGRERDRRKVEKESQIPMGRGSKTSGSRSGSRQEMRGEQERDYFSSRDGRQVPDGRNSKEPNGRLSIVSTTVSTSASGRERGNSRTPEPTQSRRNDLPASDSKLSVGLERRIATLEKELDESARREKWERERNRELEEEVRGLKSRTGEHAGELRSVQREVDEIRGEMEAEKRKADGKRRELEAEVGKWRGRCERLEEELEGARRVGQDRGDQDAAVSIRELQNEVVILMDELKTLSARNEEMILEKDADLQTMRELDETVAGYKSKWESAKTELRNLKATSTMFISKPVTDDHLPASADGNIADVHVTAFQSSIDSLLTAARSTSPTGVLPAMKGVVEAITNISDDLKAYEAKPNFPVDSSKLENVKHRSTTTLNALMQAARNHAMSSGLSPVSLLDAAAGHVSTNVVEIIKLLKIKKTSQKKDNRTSVFQTINKRQDSIEKLRDVTPIMTSGLGGPKRELNGSAVNGIPDSARMDREDSSRSAISMSSDAFELDNRKTATSLTTLEPGKAFPFPPSSSRISDQRGSGDRVESPLTYNGYANPPRSSSKKDARPVPQPTGRDDRSSGSNASGQDGISPFQSNFMARNGRSGGNSTVEGRSDMSGGTSPPVDVEEDSRRREQEWEELKPYLQTQSSALVNAIQKLLADIRNNGQGSAITDHLSEVIAIGSSIVAVAGDSLPTAQRDQGEVLLEELSGNTDRLSQYQSQTTFEKSVRQDIASAAFGIAKSLKALMRLGEGR